MNNLPSHSPVFEDDPEQTYCIEMFAKLAGLNTQTLLYYKELGVLTPCSAKNAPTEEFNIESLRQITRLEQLREIHELKDSALVLIHNLLQEIESLREERRRRY